MKKILFVCHGNICRSPMAEFVMKDLIDQYGLEDQIYVESRATSTEDIGDDIYPLARDLLTEKDIECEGHEARQITKEDLDNFDMIVAMDDNNLKNLDKMFGDYQADKISLLMDHTKDFRDVEDPWYTRNFEQTYKDVVKGCHAILDELGIELE